MTPPADPDLLARIHRESFAFFERETNPANGLVRDGTVPDSPASIAGVGFALAGYPIAVERGWMPRAEALKRTLAALRFFWEAPQNGDKDGTGHRGFFYHFLDMETGRRAWKSELSTIDTALLVAGALAAGQYFRDAPEVGRLASALYRRVEWDWALDTESGKLSHGWTPEKGLLKWTWDGYSEAILLYALALGSPSHPIPAGAYEAFTASYRWKTHYGIRYLYAGPLFIHQFSHLWIDFRGLQDAPMRAEGLDYFLNSRRACYVQRAYAARNPRGFERYGPDVWGFTASDGPGPTRLTVGGRSRFFHGYKARGVPYGPDDGTLAPWAAVASLPFAPEIVLSCIRCVAHLHADHADRYGFEASYNPTFPNGSDALGWISPYHYALNQGPITLAMENYFSGLVWRLMRACEPIALGLRRAGFTGGWLGDPAAEVGPPTAA